MSGNIPEIAVTVCLNFKIRSKEHIPKRYNIFLKSLLNLLQYCFCFMFWFFGCDACGILAPRPGIEPAPPALEGLNHWTTREIPKV